MYALAGAKHTTVGELFGTDKRRYTIQLPPKLAEFAGEDTITVTEEKSGLSGSEFAFWLAYYEIESEKNKR